MNGLKKHRGLKRYYKDLLVRDLKNKRELFIRSPLYRIPLVF